jgi:dTDP-4-amino-4,6-dideoxygalactose transaminase
MFIFTAYKYVVFETVLKFEETIAKFYNAPFAVTTDSCTHAIELALRYTKTNFVQCPKHTYLSIPMTFIKLGLEWNFTHEEWNDFYYVSDNIIDSAVFWKEGGYISNTYMCLSFQFKKHLSLGRGGAILCDHKEDYDNLKKMSYDGRLPTVPWVEQNIDTIGYHYYMTPETAELGLTKFNEVKNSIPKLWDWRDYPNLENMKIFKD